MAKEPNVTIDQLGAVIDALTAINAAMFSMLASPSQIDGALVLLDEFRSLESDPDPLQQIRASVAAATAKTLRGLHEGGPGRRHRATN